MARTGMAIGEFSRRTGGNIETIRYYERIGLLPLPARIGRYRCYQPSDVRRLLFIRRARELGFTLDEVRVLLELAENGGKATCANARDIATSQLAKVEARISDLRRMKRALTEAIQNCGDDELSGCPLIASLSENP